MLFALLALAIAATPAAQEVVCIGDSITAGAGLEAQHAWPLLLEQRMEEGAHVVNLGVSGATLLQGTDNPYLASARWSKSKVRSADVVIVMLGTNDSVLQERRKCWDKVDQLPDDLNAMLSAIQQRFGTPHILLCSPPPMFANAAGIKPPRTADLSERAPRLKELARAYRNFAIEHDGVEYVDVSRVLKVNMVTDGVHLTPFGSAAIADHLAARLRTPPSTAADSPATKLMQQIIKLELLDFHGYEGFGFYLPGQVACKLVRPHTAAAGHPWIWRARFWGHQPELDLALLERGFHLVYCDVANLYGSPTAVARWRQAYEFLHEELGLGAKPVLEGLSRGGLIVLNFAVQYPDDVAAIVLDNGVCDFRSWPGGKNGKRSDADWQQLLQAYGLEDERAWSGAESPLNDLGILAKERLPIHVLLGTADDVVPPAENGAKLIELYQDLGGPVTTWLKPGKGHHPHGLNPVQPLVRSLLRDIGFDAFNPASAIVPSVEYRGHPAGWGGGTWLNQLHKINQLAEQNPELDVVFFGDSITQGMTGSADRLTHQDGKRAIDRIPNTVSLGLSGDRTEHLRYRLRNGALTTLDPEVIVLQIGVNNINAFHTAQEVTEGLALLTKDILQQEPQATILICGPFPCGKSAADIRRQVVEELHLQAAQLAEHEHVIHMDLRSLFLDEDGNTNAMMAGDAIHISAAGKQTWIDAIAPTIHDLVNRN
ncbi:MAG: prolyl oligopeptidase family serine peptidase [Planctomycetes bacterium]|nr:prolyl oligopeptidase family serine peptidase [Planctomycetota bacterium]MCP4771408.1 prolyl oligopeptidase family serine peptidase [Planctomycetota bacterium]MCP4861845.1 prolyl oligopeptidase family serine peptidase [Planctomycetota bacterium]